jgi:tight adherence protein C
VLQSNLAKRLGLSTDSGIAPKPPRTPFRVGILLPAKKTQAFDDLLLEFPQHLEVMASRLQNGENIYSVFSKQGAGTGKLATAFKRLAIRVQLGENIEVALAALESEVQSPLIAEFVNKVTLSLRRGTPLAAQLRLLAASARGKLRVAQLKAAGRNELMMLVPLVFLILPVTVAFAVLPSLQLLQLGL